MVLLYPRSWTRPNEGDRINNFDGFHLFNKALLGSEIQRQSSFSWGGSGNSFSGKFAVKTSKVYDYWLPLPLPLMLCRFCLGGFWNIFNTAGTGSGFKKKNKPTISRKSGLLPYLNTMNLVGKKQTSSTKKCTPLKANMTGWKITMFNRRYTSSFIVVFPASHSLVNSGFFPPSIPYSWQVVWFSSMDWVRGLCQVADFTNGTRGRVGLSSWVWGAGCFSDFIGNMWGIFGED